MSHTLNQTNLEFLQDHKLSIFMGTSLATFMVGAAIGLFLILVVQASCLTLRRVVVVMVLLSLAIAHSSICLWASWLWFIRPTHSSSLSVSVWPLCIIPISSALLIGGVQIEIAYRTYSLSQPRHRIIPVLVICFALAEIVFGACRSMEILENRKLKNSLDLKPMLYPFWITLVVLGNSMISILTVHLIFKNHLVFTSTESRLSRWISTFVQAHLLTLMISLLSLMIFLIKKDSTYLAIEIGLGNLYLVSLLLGFSTEPLNPFSESHRPSTNCCRSSRTKSSGDLAVENLTQIPITIQVPMAPICHRFRPSPTDDDDKEEDWQEVFAQGIESDLTLDLPKRSNSYSFHREMIPNQSTSTLINDR